VPELDATGLLVGVDGDLLTRAGMVPVEGRGAARGQGAEVYVGPQHQVIAEVLVFGRDRLEVRADGAGHSIDGVSRSTPVASFAVTVAGRAIIVEVQEAVVFGVAQVELGGGQLLVVGGGVADGGSRWRRRRVEGGASRWREC
jgi:hypothetical protein